MKTAGTPKACYVCYKPTTTVLATKDTVDFLYSCDGHLKDPGFASLVATPAPELQKAPAVSAEEIARVKKEWEDKQKKKREAEEKKKDEEKKDGEETKVKVIKSPPATSSPAPPATPTHERYTLHRDFFASES